MTIWQALGFMFLGGTLVELFDLRAWKMYREGKREGSGNSYNRR